MFRPNSLRPPESPSHPRLFRTCLQNGIHAQLGQPVAILRDTLKLTIALSDIKRRDCSR